MKIFDILIHTVVLWTVVESRNVGRFQRSLDIEGKGSNLTKKQHEEVIHSDILQHFTTIPPLASETNGDHSTPSLIKDLPFLPEDINIQSLKNDDHLRVSYNRKISVEKENPDTEPSHDQHKSHKTNTNDVIYFNYNKTGASSSTASEVNISHSSYEHSSTSVVYDEDESDEQTQGYSSTSSTTETSKVGSEWKNLEAKKKEKGKKEILDTVTVPTDSIGAGKIEKLFKDSLLSIKLKEKNKDSISEALDDRRSTTSRISSSSSISLSDHDNNKFLSSLELLKVNSPNTNNKEAVNQSVNSVINVNGVNNDSLKKPKVKTSLKRIQEDSSNTEVDNSAASSARIIEDTAKNTVPVVHQEISTTPSPVLSSTALEEKTTNHKQYPPVRRSQLTEPFPTKVDILPKATIPSTTTVIKPSLAFKQQLVNKLKGLEAAPTATVAPVDETDEVQGKIGGKSSTKFTLRKKPKFEHVSLPEMNIPPTATAWSLASLKSSTETLGSSQKPESSPETHPLTDATTTPRLSTIVPVSRVKSFVPWSTRLLKSTSTRPPTTASIDVENMTSTSEPEKLSLQDKNNTLLNSETDFSKVAQPPTTEVQSVIRTTMELDRNHSETHVDVIQPMHNDVMVKDQSSPTPQHTVNSEIRVSSTETSDIPIPQETEKEPSDTHPNKENESQVVENVIESKQLSEENVPSNTEEKNQERTEGSSPNNTNVFGNQILQSVVNENGNEVKANKNSVSKDLNDVIIVVKTSPTPDVENIKVKNISDQLDPGTDLAVDGPGEEGKSGEESEEEERQNQTTTLPPIFEPIETTTIMDLDEDVDGESREDDDFPLFINKTTKVSTDISSKPNETGTSPGFNPSGSLDVNGTGTYVTSFDIISKENVSQVVTRTPSEVDINWYSVDTRQNNESVEETSAKPTPAEVTTTVVMETTIEPETTTKGTEQETTVLPEYTDRVTMMTPTTTVAGGTLPSTVAETVTVDVNRDPGFDSVEDPSSCVRIVVHMSPLKLCREQQRLRETIATQLAPQIVSWDQVQILKPQECESEKLSIEKQHLSVNVCFNGQDGLPSPTIRNEFLKHFTTAPSDPNFPIINVQMIMDTSMAPDGFDNVLAAIILSVIAAICLVLLGILLVIVRKRQGRFNYGQRCTPVSLDDYSLDNISVYNSVRRKGALRASKRSYGNPGFDDPGAPNHPINFAGLANFSSDREALDEEFNQIPMITVKPDELPVGAESKNRYANVIPLPETRVVLQTKEGANPLDEYINANYIKGAKSQEKLYIACQAPLQSTIEDFWKMVWQQQTKVILMLTALNENGVEKCADYLPQLEITDCHRMFGDFQVTLKKHEVREKYIISSLQLKNLETNLWREVTHLWYVSWPAQGVPEDCSSMIAFLIEARSYMRGAQGPTVVHCSPGTGRTGTVIAIDLCIRDFETLRSVDIPKTVYALRRDRAGAVQTKDQYAFIYKVLNLYATKLTGGALDSI